MFIQTETTPEPNSVRFLPGRQVMPAGTANFANADAAGAADGSPLAGRLFAVAGVAAVALDGESITVTKDDGHDWQILKPAVLGAIMEHFMTDEPVVAADAGAGAASNGGAEEPGTDSGNGADSEPDAEPDPEIVATIKELIDTRIRPVTAQEGGEVAFHSYKDGVVYLDLKGPVQALMGPITNMLRHYVPEVTAVRDSVDTIPKPGLETPVGQAVRRLLDEQINPSVASHGGHIALVDVQDERVYVRLEGGCQGCGMANVTLKQGIETALRKEIPEITTVLDVTDHAGGTNPYYQPSQK